MHDENISYKQEQKCLLKGYLL